MSLSVPAPAKVNLVLRVYDVGPDGYHAIRTLFCTLELADEVVVTGRLRTPGIELVVEGAHIGPPETNLAYRAAEAFMHAGGGPDGVHIRLVKRVPVGAGLGGGSSDAAAVLGALASIYPDFVAPDLLAALAAQLGADVPFFLGRRPLAWGEGRGERLLMMRPLPARPVVLAVPPFRIATRDAYGWLDRNRAAHGVRPVPPNRPPPRPIHWTGVATIAANDFEDVVFGRYPQLRAAHDTLREAGAAIALLSGSGSTVFAVFDDDASADAAAELLAGRDPMMRILRARTATR